MKRIILFAALLGFAVFVMPTSANAAAKKVRAKVINKPDNPVPVQGSVEVTNPADTPLDVNVVNDTPIAVDANVSFPPTLDVNIVNTEPISTTPEVPVSNIVNRYVELYSGMDLELYTVPAGKTFTVTDVIIDIASPSGLIDGILLALETVVGYDERAYLVSGAYSFRSGLIFNEGETIIVVPGGEFPPTDLCRVTLTGFLQ